MVKKIYAYLMFLLIITTLIPSFNINAMEERTSISDWALDEVTEAIDNELVEEHLKGDYQKPIKRYEYVLLALQVLEKAGMDLKIKQSFIFDDIIGHEFEEEILKAYHAGIISGYGNGLFKPDENITRQEIATLIVKLLKSLYPERNDFYNVKNNAIQYSDSNIISSWAKDSIDYCFNNEIMKGIGKDKNGLDIINPLGTATREESIILMYRLANKEKIINPDSYGIVVIDENNSPYYSSKNAGENFDITYFMRNFSKEIADIILSLNEEENVNIIDINDKYVLIFVNNETAISLSKYDEGIGLEMSSDNIIKSNSIKIYENLLKSLNSDEELLDSFSSGIKRLYSKKESTFESFYNNSYYISISSDDTLSNKYYLINYYEKL